MRQKWVNRREPSRKVSCGAPKLVLSFITPVKENLAMGCSIPAVQEGNYHPGLKECRGYLRQFRTYKTLFKSSRLRNSAAAIL
jgi:hypothetical protein